MDPSLHPALTQTSTDNRPRARSRGMSFRSDQSGGSGSKIVESPNEKAQRHSIWTGHSKANPNAAINEAQPAANQELEQSTLKNLRDGAGQYKDIYGNVIADPDLCNPTRPRMERPLDTIRSFEKAIDEGYKRRNSYMKQDAEQFDKDNQFASRRSSYFGGYDNGPSPGRPGPGGQGGGYYGSQSYYGPPRARHHGNRMASDPQMYGGQRPYPQHGHHQSHDTVNTGMTNGSDSTGPWGNSTDPSSENSSIDKVNAMNKPPTPMDNHNPYGNGYHGPIMEEQSGSQMYGDYHQDSGPRPGNGYANGYPQQNGFAPRGQPAQQPGQARRPIQLGGGGGADDGYGRPPPSLPSSVRREPEKEEKKSWIKRRFSKKG